MSGSVPRREPGRRPGERRTQTRVIAADPACRVGGDGGRNGGRGRATVTDCAARRSQMARSIRRFALPSSSSLCILMRLGPGERRDPLHGKSKMLSGFAIFLA